MGFMSAPEHGDPPWLTEDQLNSWKAVVALTMTLPAALDAQLKRDTGLNSFDYHVLAALADLPDGAMGMGELATLSQGSPSRLSHAVARMERAGWIERRNGEARCVNAHLTAAGRRKLVASAPGHVHEVRRLVIDALTADQLRVLGEAARLVAAQADPVMAAALARGCDGSECSEDLAASGNPDDPECADGSACLEAG
jgi:DNA-binding MarR family transcriptional regulator